MTKIEQNTFIWPFILILWIGPTSVIFAVLVVSCRPCHR